LGCCCDVVVGESYGVVAVVCRQTNTPIWRNTLICSCDVVVFMFYGIIAVVCRQINTRCSCDAVVVRF